MNFIQFESAQKLRGGFYTDQQTAAFLVRWVSGAQPKRILEPSCGDGRFLAELERINCAGLEQVVACELNPEEAAKARTQTRLPLEVKSIDFLRWFLFEGSGTQPFDAVVGNPPFIRYQYLPEAQQQLAEVIFRQVGAPFTKHTNAWVPFVLASLRLLRAGGRLAFVVPSEILHIMHAQGLRSYLARECARVLLLDPEEIWFTETLQGTALLLAEKKSDRAQPGAGVAVTSIADRAGLDRPAEDYFRCATFINGPSIERKWMPVLLSQSERDVYQNLRQLPTVKKFSETASVDVGIVTGANKFFLVPDSTVEEFSLQRWAFPMFGRSEHVPGLIYTQADHVANKVHGYPTNFLWFQQPDPETYPEPVRRYFALGQEQRLHTRFKCRVRTPWFRVPSVSTAPIAMLKRAHHYPRLILNEANAFTTDTAYRVHPINAEPGALVSGFVNSLTCLSAELEGRHYGGGVLELVPSEIENLLVPQWPVTSAELGIADAAFRACSDETTFLRSNDELVLGGIGLSGAERVLLHEAWLRLRHRRQRRVLIQPSEDGAVPDQDP